AIVAKWPTENALPGEVERIGDTAAALAPVDRSILLVYFQHIDPDREMSELEADAFALLEMDDWRIEDARRAALSPEQRYAEDIESKRELERWCKEIGLSYVEEELFPLPEEQAEAEAAALRRPLSRPKRGES